jgi:hypothetical protein
MNLIPDYIAPLYGYKRDIHVDLGDILFEIAWTS